MPLRGSARAATGGNTVAKTSCASSPENKFFLCVCLERGSFGSDTRHHSERDAISRFCRIVTTTSSSCNQGVANEQGGHYELECRARMVITLWPGLPGQRLSLLRHSAAGSRLQCVSRRLRGRPRRRGDQRFQSRRDGGYSAPTCRRPRGPARCSSCLCSRNPPTSDPVNTGTKSRLRSEDRAADRLAFIKGARLLSGSDRRPVGGCLRNTTTPLHRPRAGVKTDLPVRALQGGRAGHENAT